MYSSFSVTTWFDFMILFKGRGLGLYHYQTCLGMVPASEASWRGIATGGLAWPVLGACKQIAAWVWFLAESRYQNRSRSCSGKLEQATFMPRNSLTVY